MWAEISYWLGWLALGVAPGWALLRLSGLRWATTEQLAAAPGLSIAAVALAAYLAQLVGLPVTWWSVVALLVGGAAALVSAQRLGPWRAHGEPGPRPREPWVGWLVLALPLGVYLLLLALRSAVILPPTVDDGVHHATWARLIFERHTLSPAAIYAPPVSDHRPVAYPWGFHAWVALVARPTSLVWIEAYWRSALTVGACVPLSVYALAAKVLPRGWPCVAAALCSALFFWLPFQPYLWGGLPLLAGALCALPVARFALDALADRRWPPLGLAAALGGGLLLVHPSQAQGALLVCLLFALAQRVEQRSSWRACAWLLGALALLALVVTVGARHWETAAAFVRRAELVAQGKGDRLEAVWWWVRDLYACRGPGAAAVSVLCVAGLVTAAWQPTLRVVLWLHLGLLALLPLAMARTWLTALWYHDLERLWYLQIAAVPLLGASGLWGLVMLLSRATRQRGTTPLGPQTLWPLLLALVAGSGRSYAAQAARRLQLARTAMASDPSYLADFSWIREQVAADALILNAPGDWGLVLPFTGRLLTFANCQVQRSVPAHFEAFWTLHDVGNFDEEAHRRLRALGVRYVYAGFYPEFAVGTRRGLTLEPRALGLNPGLERVYESRTAQIFRVREALDPGFPRIVLPLDESSPARFEGFAGFERRDGRFVRWTGARSLMRIPSQTLPEDEGCALVLGMRRPRQFPVEVAWDGQPLEAAAEGVYPLPPRADVLEIRSRTFVPNQLDPSADDARVLGVALRGLSVECAADDQEGATSQTGVIPLGGSPDASFIDFHPVERSAEATWRWTTGRSLVRLRQRALPQGPRCVLHVALGGGPRASVIVSWNGERLLSSGRGSFPLGDSAQYHRLQLSSRTQPQAGLAEPVGVGLWRVGLHCAPRPAAGP